MLRRSLLLASVTVALVIANSASALAQPGIGGGSGDAYQGGDRGSVVVVTGSYTPAPAAVGSSGSGAPQSSSSSAGGASAPAAPAGPQQSIFPQGEGTLGVVTPAQMDACGVLAANCVLLAPDVGVPETPPIVDVLTVAQMAVTAMQLEPPPICMTPGNGTPPPPGITGLVGLWSWMWMCENQIRESTVGPVTRVASVGAVTVTATAVHAGIVLNPGTGQPPVFCPPGPQVPYADVFLDFPSPSGCSFHLEKSSELEGGGTFKPSATSNWVVTWTATTPAGVQGGVIPQALTSRTEIRIGEMQVLVHN